MMSVMMMSEMADMKVKLSEVNHFITCGLCFGYLYSAVTISECLHSFCKTCLVRYIASNRLLCPVCCLQIHPTDPFVNVRHDATLQNIIYKLLPHLEEEELRKEKEFNKQHNVVVGSMPKLSKAHTPAHVQHSASKTSAACSSLTNSTPSHTRAEASFSGLITSATNKATTPDATARTASSAAKTTANTAKHATFATIPNSARSADTPNSATKAAVSVNSTTKAVVSANSANKAIVSAKSAAKAANTANTNTANTANSAFTAKTAAAGTTLYADFATVNGHIDEEADANAEYVIQLELGGISPEAELKDRPVPILSHKYITLPGRALVSNLINFLHKKLSLDQDIYKILLFSDCYLLHDTLDVALMSKAFSSKSEKLVILHYFIVPRQMDWFEHKFSGITASSGGSSIDRSGSGSIGAGLEQRVKDVKLGN